MKRMQVGFSYVGLLFLLLLLVPNAIWTKHKPDGYDAFAARENVVLRGLERIGEVSVTALCLLSAELTVGPLRLWSLWLLAAVGLMLLYEWFWIRYFRSAHRMQDFYRSLLGIPVAGATLPVVSCFLLAIYGGNWMLGVATVVLGIGHIGIHVMHRRALNMK